MRVAELLNSPVFAWDRRTTQRSFPVLTPPDDAMDRVGFFTVMKLIGVMLAVLIPALAVHALVMRGIFNETIDQKISTVAVAKLEYDIRRVEIDKALLRIERNDGNIEERLRTLEVAISELRERQIEIRKQLERHK